MRSFRFRFQRVFGVAALTLGAACAEPTAPVPPSGVFVLETYASHALPTVVWENPAQRGTLIADTVALSATGTGVRIQWQRMEPGAAGAPFALVRIERPLKIVARGGELRAEEEVICFLTHVTESCTDLWSAPVGLSGIALTIGPRVYARLAAAP